jgi:hypothetical protein
LITEVLQPRVYQLQEINGMTIPNVWNIEQLRKFYPFLQARGGWREGDDMFVSICRGVQGHQAILRAL